MDGLLSFLCLLCVLITPGSSLSCVKCSGLNSCTGPAETCQSNHTCGLFYRETTETSFSIVNEARDSQTAYLRSCVPTSKCNKVGSISYTGGTIKMGISCCDSDNCTPPPPKWPAGSSQANGKVCPSCQSQTLGRCNQEMNIQCTGSLQTCLFESTATSGNIPEDEHGWIALIENWDSERRSISQTTGSIDNAMGCATPTFCDMVEYSYASSSYNISMEFYCFPATNSSVTGTSCVICTSGDSLTCTGSLSVIPPNSRCASAYLITTKNETKTYEVTRSWVPVSKCNITGSMTVSGTKFSMGISCCDGDGCTPSIQDTTSTSAVSNGVQCKTCESVNSSSCEANTTMNCTGQETQCMNYAQTTTLGNPEVRSTTLSFRGCGTKSLCDAQNFSYTMNYMSSVNGFDCESTTIDPSTTTPSNRGTTTPSNRGTTTPSNRRTTTPRNGGSSTTTSSNGGLIFLLLSTFAAILILHQFNKDP